MFHGMIKSIYNMPLVPFQADDSQESDFCRMGFKRLLLSLIQIKSLLFHNVLKSRFSLVLYLLTGFILFPSTSRTDIVDIRITDVTTRAFSVICVSDEPIVEANTRVYSDSAGTAELNVTVNVVSDLIADAHDNGIVKVDVTGLDANTTVYVQTETTTASGTQIFPETNPFLEVTTAFTTTKTTLDTSQVIANDLLQIKAFGVDGLTPLPGSLIVVDIPSIADYPLSAFVGHDGFPESIAAVNLNNIFSAGSTTEVADGEIITIEEIRGMNCDDLQHHNLQRFGKVPKDEESLEITELASPTPCFSADTVCDDVVDMTDFQFVLENFNSALGECAFNPSVDTVNDNVVNVLDAQLVLKHLGESVPFE